MSPQIPKKATCKQNVEINSILQNTKKQDDSISHSCQRHAVTQGDQWFRHRKSTLYYDLAYLQQDLRVTGNFLTVFSTHSGSPTDFGQFSTRYEGY